MNKTVRDILLFAAGFGAGALVMHTVFEKKYETYYGKKYEAERENLRQKEADMDKTIEERATQKSFEQLAGKYRTESDPEDVVAHEAIEVIEPDQFGELDDYETSFLTYYADGKLVFDTEDQPVDDDDIPKIIGNEALDRIGEFAPNAVMSATTTTTRTTRFSGFGRTGPATTTRRRMNELYEGDGAVL